MDFGQSIQTCFRKYAEFNGRASRSEFWYFFLFQILAYMAIGLLGGLLWRVVALGLLLPGIAVQVRRLHDQGRSGWFYLLCFIPLVGAIIILVWNCQRGTVGPNAYGEDPVTG